MSITLLDGGMGQELVARSSTPPSGLWSAQMLLDAPELIQSVHIDFFVAGAEIATTNSYILHRDRLSPFGKDGLFESLNIAACEIACRARDEHGQGMVAGGMGPNGRSYRPDLALDVAKGAEVFAEIANIQAPFVDLFLLETMSSLQQAEGAAMGAMSVGKPVWLSLSVDDEDGTKLRSGEPLIDIIPIVKRLGLDALLINCSTPEAVTTALIELGNQSFTIGAYANGFNKISETFKGDNATVDTLETRHDLGPIPYADFAQQWLTSGASIIGGCCEVGPKHIRELARRFK
jgi:S-methylmethionine-dependent homocysteine/selenocysteine methylase